MAWLGIDIDLIDEREERRLHIHEMRKRRHYNPNDPLLKKVQK